jgi:DNA repair protein RadC
MTEPLSIQQLPPDMRPREKLLKHGPSSLSDVELLALQARACSRWPLSCSSGSKALRG